MNGEERLIDARPAKAVPDECDACADALVNAYTGMLNAGCRGCMVRWVSNVPKIARDRHYASIADPEERVAFAKSVLAEFERRHQLVERVRKSA